MCECGAQAKFFQLQSGKHVCEKCILNEIYADESYEDVYLKVLNKMQNIMRLRMKQLQSYKADFSNRQSASQQPSATAAKPPAKPAATTQQNPATAIASPVEESKERTGGRAATIDAPTP